MTRAIAVQVILGVLLEIWFSTQAPGHLEISCNSKNCSAYRALGTTVSTMTNPPTSTNSITNINNSRNMIANTDSSNSYTC